MAKPFSIFTVGDRNDHSKVVKQLLSNQQPPLRAKSVPKRPSSANYNNRQASHAKASRNNRSNHNGDDRGVISREDLIIELSDTKKKNRVLEETISHLKGENQRLESEAHKQQRRIDQLLNLSDGVKSSGLSAEIRRDIEKSILVRQLKVQIANLRGEFAEKDSELEALRRNIKATHLVELENERDECLLEVQRLRQALAEAKEELFRERQRREWNNRVAGDNSDDLRREVARLSTGYQNILTNISKRIPSGSRPSTAGNTGRGTSSSSGPATGNRSSSRDAAEWGNKEYEKRPQSAGHPTGAKSQNSKRFDGGVESPYLASNPHSPAAKPSKAASYDAGPDGANSAGAGRPTVAPVFADPLDNFGLAAPESLAGMVLNPQVENAVVAPAEPQQLQPTAAATSSTLHSEKHVTHENVDSDWDSANAVPSPAAAATVVETVEAPLAITPASGGPSGSRFQVKSRVQGYFGGGPSWYDGTIRAVNADGTYQVDYDDGDEELYVLATNLRPIRDGVDESDVKSQAQQESAQQAAVDSGAAPAFNVGDVVEALYYNGKTWYGGKITAVFPSPSSGTDFVYDITYDDGEREPKVPSANIRNKASSTAVASSASPAGSNAGAASVAKVPSSKSKFKSGDKVEGRFDGGADWYKATVSVVHDDNTYDLAYDDGDREYKVLEQMIRSVEPEASAVPETVAKVDPPGATFAVGQRVKAFFEQYNEWYAGVVKKVNSDGTYRIAYDDGDEETSVQASRMQPEVLGSAARTVAAAVAVESKFKSGDKVEGRFDGGADWYKATVSVVHDDNTYDLAYDDGDRENKVLEQMIRSVEPEPSAPVNGNDNRRSNARSSAQPHVTNTNLDSFLNELSDDDSAAVGGGIDAGPPVSLAANGKTNATSPKRGEDDYDEDFDA